MYSVAQKFSLHFPCPIWLTPPLLKKDLRLFTHSLQRDQLYKHCRVRISQSTCILSSPNKSKKSSVHFGCPICHTPPLFDITPLYTQSPWRSFDKSYAINDEISIKYMTTCSRLGHQWSESDHGELKAIIFF